ncbi:MAG: hypothetical protein QOI06_2950, partial [Nocardioidaceae bacterium]|nr:hypothetical protein [Nocardioidaceae bacterium]
QPVSSTATTFEADLEGSVLRYAYRRLGQRSGPTLGRDPALLDLVSFERDTIVFDNRRTGRCSLPRWQVLGTCPQELGSKYLDRFLRRGACSG